MAGPRITVVQDGEELARVAADLVADVISAIPAASIVAATGKTPMGLYAELAARRRAGILDTGAISAVQLDEYLGLEPDDDRSLLGWLQRSFLEPLGVGDDRVLRLPVDGDLDTACAAFDRTVEARGIDLAILGLGPNGHLGFNEPPSDPKSPTRVVELTPITLEANARYWGEGAEVPSEAVTLGMPHLLSARTVVLVIAGGGKRDIARRALTGPIGPEVPASFLQQTDAAVIVDRDAWGEP